MQVAALYIEVCSHVEFDSCDLNVATNWVSIERQSERPHSFMIALSISLLLTIYNTI